MHLGATNRRTSRGGRDSIDHGSGEQAWGVPRLIRPLTPGRALTPLTAPCESLARRPSLTPS